jgi:hypothetical protein
MPVKTTQVTSILESIRKKIRKLGLTEKDVKEAIRWARSRKK